MTLKELMEKATPGEWYLGIGEQYCFHAGNRVTMCVGFEEGGEQSEATIAEFWPADHEKDIIDAKLLLHCKKHFAQVVEALNDLFEDWVTLIGEDLKEENADVKAIWKKAEDALAAAQIIPSEEKYVPEAFKQRLEYLRGELRAERISTGELVELESLKEFIEPGDVELLEAAGVPEEIPMQGRTFEDVMYRTDQPPK